MRPPAPLHQLASAPAPRETLPDYASAPEAPPCAAEPILRSVATATFRNAISMYCRGKGSAYVASV